MPSPEDYAAKKLASLLGTSETQTENPSKPGPRTAAGKARSAVNALRHGLSGRIVVLPTEDMSQYLKFSQEFVDTLYPATPLESELAQTVADGYWRLKRFRTVEEGMLAMGHYEKEGDFDADTEEVHSVFTAAKAFRANSQAFVNLSIYEQRIQRGIEKSMKQLRELQTERKERRQAEMAEVLRLRDYHEMISNSIGAMATRSSSGELIPAKLKQRYEPVVDGFVYSSHEIETEAHRRDRREQALAAAKVHFNRAAFDQKAA
jgi:hypothetical protein